jgi:hypothetical protein
MRDAFFQRCSDNFIHRSNSISIPGRVRS